jgi:hypothetical protein
MLGLLGYELVVRDGRTRGSRRTFYNQQRDLFFYLDEPHDGEMTLGLIKRSRQHLEEHGLI